MVKIRFRNFADNLLFPHFIEIIELSLSEKVVVSENFLENVDLEITGPYFADSDNFKTPLIKRIKRFGYVTFTHGKHLVRRDLAVGIQVRKSAARNIWYTGENVRPPQGVWDGIFSFDLNLDSNRSLYVPLWFMTSTDLFKSTKLTYWGAPVPAMKDLLNGRVLGPSKNKKFAAAFIGKNYPMRLHAIESLAKAGNIDVFGESVRNKVKEPYKKARNYRYIMCFENDIYPGYVTEKPFEAYLAGAIPLYYGLDKAKFLNPKAIVNLYDFQNLSDWIEHIKAVENSSKLFRQIYEQPILRKKPSLDPIITFIKAIFENQ